MSHEAVSDDLHYALDRKNHKKYILYFFLKHKRKKPGINSLPVCEQLLGIRGSKKQLISNERDGNPPRTCLLLQASNFRIIT